MTQILPPQEQPYIASQVMCSDLLPWKSITVF